MDESTDKGGYAQAIIYARFVNSNTSAIDTKLLQYSELKGALMQKTCMVHMLKWKAYRKIGCFHLQVTVHQS